MHYDAILVTHKDNLVVGRSSSGFIFEDKHTHGNHPFPDGCHIYTSTVQAVDEKNDGNVYVRTINTVYLWKEELPQDFELPELRFAKNVVQAPAVALP